MRSVFVILMILSVPLLLAADGGPPGPKPDAGPAPNPIVEKVEHDPTGAVSDLVAAVRSGQWRQVAALALALLMLALGKVRGKIKLFDGDRGGAILVGLLALSGAMISALVAQAPFDFKLLLGTLGVAFTAVGGYTWFKRLLWPADAPQKLELPLPPPPANP